MRSSSWPSSRRLHYHPYYRHPLEGAVVEAALRSRGYVAAAADADADVAAERSLASPEVGANAVYCSTLPNAEEHPL